MTVQATNPDPSSAAESPVDFYVDFHAGSKGIQTLADYYLSHVGDRNEATTRLHLVDTLIFDCLAWKKIDAIPEEEQRVERRSEYTDYTFYAPRKSMILEAKREGIYLELPTSKTAHRYEIKSLWRGNAELKRAMEQVAGYCQSRGVSLAVVTNGHQIVAFIATRSDGIAPFDGECVVFPTLQFMAEHFTRLWNYLSKPGVEEKNLERFLLGTSRPTLPPPLATSIVDYPGRKDRNVFQTDLKIVADLVLEDLTTSEAVEEQFLKECYCHPGALSQYSLAAKSILSARYAALFGGNEAAPTVVSATNKKGISSELLADSLSRRPILILGDVGVGKTTFIKNLIRIDGREILQDAITFYVDLGSQATLTSDLHQYIVEDINRQLHDLYDVDIEENGFVRAVYRRDLQRHRKGVFGALAESDPTRYQSKELELLARKIENRSEHLKASLQFISVERKKQLVLFLDNADQRGDATQDAAFLISQEMGAHWPLLVYVPLRPETFHASSQGGALSGYHPKAFTISPPRVDRVIDLRLRFAIKIADGAIPTMTFPETLRPRIHPLKQVMGSFLDGMSQNRELVECIDNLSGGIVRSALQYVKGFFGSGHVDTQKIVQAYSGPTGYSVSMHEFLRATMFGDAAYYYPSTSPLANIFSVSSNDSREHFLLPILLGILGEATSTASERGFVLLDDLYRSLQGLGFIPEQIDTALVNVHRKRLVETSGRKSLEDRTLTSTAARATTVGLYHAMRLVSSFQYVDAMSVVTPIFDADAAARIRDVHYIRDRIDRVRVFSGYLDAQWGKLSCVGTSFDWSRAASLLEEDIRKTMESSKQYDRR